MKKIVKSLSLLALLPVLSLGVTSCGFSKVKDVKTAASKVSESIAATPTVYKQKAEKADFFSLKAAASVNVDEQNLKSSNSLDAQLVVNPDFVVELTKEEPNINNLTLVDSMYFNAKSYSTNGESEDTTFIEVGVYDDVAYGHSKIESTGKDTVEVKDKFVGVNDWIKNLIQENLPTIQTDDVISTPIDNNVLTVLDALEPATLAWLSEEITSETYVDTVGQLIISTDPEAATDFNTLKPLITNIADIARTNINTLFEIKGDEKSFSITNDTSKTKAFLNSLATYANEQAAKTEGTEAEETEVETVEVEETENETVETEEAETVKGEIKTEGVKTEEDEAVTAESEETESESNEGEAEKTKAVVHTVLDDIADPDAPLSNEMFLKCVISCAEIMEYRVEEAAYMTIAVVAEEMQEKNVVLSLNNAKILTEQAVQRAQKRSHFDKIFDKYNKKRMHILKDRHFYWK